MSDSNMNILADLRVVEYATEIAGPYCTKVFADVGADVIKVEPPEGDPFRQRGTGRKPEEDGALFRFLNAGKRSVVHAPTDPQFTALLGDADIFVESFGPNVFDYGALREQFPSLVVLALSPFGATGPYSGRPATAFTVEAESGAMSTRGRLDQPPIQVGGRLFEWLMGSYSAVAALAAARRAKTSGAGEFIDCSLMEVCHIGGSGIEALLYQLSGRPPITGPARVIELPSIEPTSDGWIGLNTNTRQQFESFLLMIGRYDLLTEDESWALATTRQARMEEWNEIVHEWTTQHTTAEIVELASLLRIPVAPVTNGETVLNHVHFAARGVWEQVPDGTFTYPLPPYRINGERPRPRDPSPKLGEHQNQIEGRTEVEKQPAQLGSASSHNLPLAGVKVIDATAWWAGPSSTQALAALGAEVIHLESIQHLDGARMTAVNFVDLPDWWERSPLFLRSNTNKRDLTLDLNAPTGRYLLEALIRESDILVENFSPRVFENFGLTWDVVREINPRIIMTRMPAFGLDGPWRDNVGFAQTMEQVTGLAWLTGHEYDQPRIPRGPCDPMAGMSSAFAMLLGLQRRDQTGEGSFIEVAMVEAALNAAAEQVIEYTAYGNVLSRLGNRSRDAAPQGLYQCRGEDNWLAVSVASDTQWQSLKEALGNPSWANSEEFRTATRRHESHDIIDRHLEAWARDQEVAQAVETLIGRGVPAAQVWDARLGPTHPQMAWRKFYEDVDHPLVGPHAVASLPFLFGGVVQWNTSSAPTLGQHNVEILSKALSVGEDALEDLLATGVIGYRPIGID